MTLHSWTVTEQVWAQSCLHSFPNNVKDLIHVGLNRLAAFSAATFFLSSANFAFNDNRSANERKNQTP